MADTPPLARSKNEDINHGHEFVQTLLSIKKGAVLQEIGENLHAVIEAVRKTKKPGKLAVSFKIKYQPGADESLDMVSIEAEVKEMIPRPSTGSSLFFVTHEGTLVRHHPRQMSIDGMD